MRTIQFRKIELLKIICLYLLLLTSPAILNSAWQTNYLPISDKIIKNPNSGLCFMPGLEPASKIPDWILEVCSIAYFRVDWANIVDDNGNYMFEELDKKIFSTYRKKGLRLAFRIMAANPHSSKKYVTPEHILKENNIPFVIHQSVYGREQMDPVFWNKNFIKEHGKMIKALGEHVDKHPDVDYIDLGGMGDWGEMHLSRWTEKELKKNGFTRKKYLQAVFEMMEQMDKYLPQTTKAFCVAVMGMTGPAPVFAQIVDRAVRNNWWLRTDGFSMEGPPHYVKPYFEKHWKQVGFIIEPAGGINRGFFGAPVPVKKYFDAVMQSHPVIVNLMGLWDLNKLADSDIRECREMAKKIGYRFVIKEVILPKKVNIPNNESTKFPIKLTIAQQGAAPFHGSAVINIELISKNKTIKQQTLFPRSPLSQILPGEEYAQTFLIEVPENLKANSLSLYLSIQDMKHGNIIPANKNTDPAGRLLIGSLIIDKAARSASYIFEMNKNTKPATLRAESGVVIKKSDNGWKIKGESESGWNFAGSRRYKVKPKHLYKMKIKLRAWKGDIKDSMLFFKFGIDNENGHWLRNVNTPRYDFNEPGSWQELSVLYQPESSEEYQFHLAIEKGRTSPSTINAEIISLTVEEIPLP